MTSLYFIVFASRCLNIYLNNSSQGAGLCLVHHAPSGAWALWEAAFALNALGSLPLYYSRGALVSAFARWDLIFVHLGAPMYRKAYKYKIRSRILMGPQVVKAPIQASSCESVTSLWRMGYVRSPRWTSKAWGWGWLPVADGPSSPVAVSENWDLQKMNLRMNAKMFANYNLYFITLCKMSVLKSF